MDALQELLHLPLLYLPWQELIKEDGEAVDGTHRMLKQLPGVLAR